MGVLEPFRRWRRSPECHLVTRIEKCFRWYGRLNSQSRRAVLLIGLISATSLYLTFHFLYPLSPQSNTSESTNEFLQKCIDDELHKLFFRNPTKTGFIFTPNSPWSSLNGFVSNKFTPMIGNGVFGIFFLPSPKLYLKQGRTLSLDTFWNPLQPLRSADSSKDFYYMDVLEGTVKRFQCLSDGLRLTYTYFAHRTNPHVFYQDILISNPSEFESFVNFDKITQPRWSSTHQNGFLSQDSHLSFSGIVKNISSQESLVVSVAAKSLTSSVQIPPHRNKQLTFPVIIIPKIGKTVDFVSSKFPDSYEKLCIEELKSVEKKGFLKLEKEHFSAWNDLWKTGLNISHSKASGALNNEQVNATEYFVLSSVPNSLTKGLQDSKNRSNYLSLVEGCYGAYHHTLQAISLWQDLVSFTSVNETVNLWLLTLEKQGCQRLLSTGSQGVAQAMTLSYGGFKFNPHHLEMKIEPKFLHRDYHFRNIMLDFHTHLNVSVILQENNKAILAVSVRSIDRDYWACDGGCVEDPVKLSSTESIFPVKMTEPSTSILYITADKSHIELIKDTLHVHNIVEAPAHDHHVVALHRHGSHLGGLPMMFWVTVITLIVIFHLFLCKLIYNEFRGKQDKGKSKYSRIQTRGV